MIGSLTYFDMRGRAEASRLLLVDVGIEFEDRRITSEQEWKKLQSALPTGALPTLSIGETSVTESQAILRYLSRLNELDPAHPSLIVRFDEAHEALAKAQEELWLSAWIAVSPYDGSTYSDSTLPRQMRGLERLRGDIASPYWFGAEPTRVDYLAFAFLDEIDAFFPNVLASFPSMSRLHKIIGERPNINAYASSSRRPAVFGIGKAGPKVDQRQQYKSRDIFECPWQEPILLEAFN